MKSCGLQLDEPQSSRKHFEVERQGSRWVLHDLGSRNGSLLNGERVNGRFPLTHGDTIRVGETVVEFQSAPPCIAVGAKLGSCEVGRAIGRSAVGALYAAKQGSLEREVTIEIADVDLAQDPAFREAYQTRARLAGSFDHPMIQAIYDTSTGGGQLYTVYEACPGPTLEAHMKKTALDHAQVLSLLADIARALAHIHGRGKRHGGLSSRTIVMAPTGPKLTELGDPNRLAPHRRDRALQAAYASSEEAQSNQVSPAADIYSLGVLAFRLLTGQLPYTGGKPNEVLKQHASANPVPLPDSLAGEVRDLLADMLSKAASSRPSAEEIADRLAAVGKRPGRRKRGDSARARGGKSSARQRKGSGRQKKGSGRIKRPPSARQRKSGWGSTSSATRKAPKRKPSLSSSSARLRQLAPAPGSTDDAADPGSGLAVVLRLVLLGIGYLLMTVAAAVATQIAMRFLG